jgi:hypothetical protein
MLSIGSVDKFQSCRHPIHTCQNPDSITEVRHRQMLALNVLSLDNAFVYLLLAEGSAYLLQIQRRIIYAIRNYVFLSSLLCVGLLHVVGRQRPHPNSTSRRVNSKRCALLNEDHQNYSARQWPRGNYILPTSVSSPHLGDLAEGHVQKHCGIVYLCFQISESRCSSFVFCIRSSAPITWSRSRSNGSRFEAD